MSEAAEKAWSEHEAAIMRSNAMFGPKHPFIVGYDAGVAAAQVVPQPNREALAKWLFEFKLPDHKGYWDAGNLSEFIKNQYRKKADELAALSPAPLTTDREALKAVITATIDGRDPARALPNDEFDGRIADAVIAHLSAQPVEGEVEVLQQALFDIFVAIGEDTDGIPDGPTFAHTVSPYPRTIVEAVATTRKEYEEETDVLTTQLQAAQATIAAAKRATVRKEQNMGGTYDALDAVTAILSRVDTSALAEHDRQMKFEGWDEACEALAWCFDNGPERDALPYLIEHNPFRPPVTPTENGKNRG